MALDQHNPSFVLYPVNNNRTAWRPFGLPMILVVPHKRDPGGAALANSQVSGVRIYIEDVPREARVAGHQNIGRRFPDRELYAENVDSLELADRLLNLQSLTYLRGGDEIEYADARHGDTISYTTATGVTAELTYLVGADYYDLSDLLIDVELLPSDQYSLVYEALYYRRVVSQDGRSDFLCIDAGTQALALHKFQIDHPGRVLEEFYRLTPPPYLTNASKAKDTTVGLYRPFTDLLQDVADEQTLLERVNWVFEAPAEAIPYLSALLGWDLPYFPDSLDQLRRAVLRRTVEFQRLKGSRRAIVNIFRLFGFEVLISNLWWSADGRRLIRPDQSLPLEYQDQTVTTVALDQVDLALNGHSVTGFTPLQIPLLFRPQEKSGLDQFTALRDGGQLLLTVYAVEEGSDAQAALDEIAAAVLADPTGYGAGAGCVEDADGYVFPQAVTDALAGKELKGYGQVQVAGRLGDPVDETLVGPVIPVKISGVSFDRENNILNLTPNGIVPHLLYGFVTYRRYEFSVPDVLAELQSNRFDLQVLTPALDQFADPTTLEFAVEFLHKLKAFHSLLNVLRTRAELTETYEVTNLCVGGEYAQRFDTDIGRLQVAPAIIPQIGGEDDCALLDPRSLGYKEADLLLRLRKLTNLPEEHAAWKALDGREPGTLGNQPAIGREECRYTTFGQDRIAVQDRVEARDTQTGPGPTANSLGSGHPANPDVSPQDRPGQPTSTNSDSSGYGSFTREYTEPPEPACELDKITDYCYKGRVEDELLYRPTIKAQELTGLRAPVLSMGHGVYWTYPAYSKISRPGVGRRDSRGLTNRIRFSGGARAGSVQHYRTGHQGTYLGMDPAERLPSKNNSLLGRLYRDYGTPGVGGETLHYTNRLGDPVVDQRYQLALQRPALGVRVATMHLPGCRFPLLNRLKEDYTSADYEARPWDFDPCGPRTCGRDPVYLNFYMVADADGNETLDFDRQAYGVAGNNMDADITAAGDHTLVTGASFADSDVVHKVYMEDAASNPAVELDGVCDFDSSVSDGSVETTEPLFSSYANCETDPTRYRDYADGYPCLSGFQDYESEGNVYADVFDGLGVPTNAESVTQVLFLLSSGIRDASRGWRLDGGCTVLACTETAAADALCALDAYVTPDGDYDFSPDHLELDVRMKLQESFTAELTQLTGTIGTLMETF